MTVYASLDDLKKLGRTLTAAQTETAQLLIEHASARLRTVARKHGRDIDSMIADPVSGEDFALAVNSVVLQAVCRALDTAESRGAIASQGTESIGAYSLTSTYFNPGQSLYFLKNELKELGLLRQRVGLVNFYGTGDSDVYES